MDNNRFLHSELLYSDAVSHFNDVWRLPDGRLFTLGAPTKVNNGGHFSKEPVSTFVIGRVSSDKGRTWEVSCFRQLPGETELTGLADFMVDRNGRIHAFFMHIYEISFETVAKCRGDITYMRIDNAEGDNMIYKKIDALDRYTGSMNNVIQLKTGRIIAPFSTISGVAGSAFTSSVVYTDDSGETWRASNDVAILSDETNVESGAVEPVVVEVKDGVLVMLIRTVLSCIWYAVSYDDGATWTQAKPTKIPSSNAPSAPVRMPDGRILLSWNNVLGEPMHGVRYSFARQCLMAAVSDDGLKTLNGVRTIVRKRADDPDNLLNCYPFCTIASDTEAFIRPFSVQNRDDVHWGDPQALLLRVRLDDLLDTGMHNSFPDWITDCECDETGIRMKPTVGGVAYANVNFPYAAEGRITLTSDGVLPAGLRLLLSDCYLDRLTFLPEKRTGKYVDVIGKPYVEIEPSSSGTWQIAWNASELTLTSGGETRKVSLADWARGFNHLSILFEGEDTALNVTGFDMQCLRGGLETGIEY